jgi:phospholipid transport system transporter-binding protein
MSVISTSPGAFAVRGAMEFANAAALLDEGLAAFAGAPAGAVITLDLAEVGRTDSAGLAVLLEWLGAARRGGHTLSVANPPANLLALARVSGLDQIILEAR